MRCEPVTDGLSHLGLAPACIGCGCTDDNACPGGCFWVSLDPPLCSACAPEEDDAERSGLFGAQRCPASPVRGPHDQLWVDERSGYCVRCRAGFMT